MWHNFSIKILSASLRGSTSKKVRDFCNISCLHSYRTIKKLESDQEICQNEDFLKILMTSEDSKILEFNQYQKSGKALFIIYAVLENIIQKIDGCKFIYYKSKQTSSIRFFNVCNVLI